MGVTALNTPSANTKSRTELGVSLSIRRLVSRLQQSTTRHYLPILRERNAISATITHPSPRCIRLKPYPPRAFVIEEEEEEARRIRRARNRLGSTLPLIPSVYAAPQRAKRTTWTCMGELYRSSEYPYCSRHTVTQPAISQTHKRTHGSSEHRGDPEALPSFESASLVRNALHCTYHTNIISACIFQFRAPRKEESSTHAGIGDTHARTRTPRRPDKRGFGMGGMAGSRGDEDKLRGRIRGFRGGVPGGERGGAG